METTFDLVDGEWIRAVERGRVRDVSLRDALTRAQDIDGLGAEVPLETVAVLRQVLLPVYWDACGFPADDEEWAARWHRGHLEASSIAGYLDANGDRFDLFGERPFAQVKGLRTGKDETKPVSVLIASVATGNNVPLFGARTEADPPALTCAQAARALLAAQCWDTAAIKSGAADDNNVKNGKTTGNPTGPLGGLGVIVPIGRNLFETLLLNTPIVEFPRPRDRPQWKAEPADRDWPGRSAWSARAAKGLLDLVTWQSRRVRLHPEVDENGVVSIRRVVLAAGDRLDQLPEYEPHTAWRQVDKPKADQPPSRPIRHVAGRAAWRGMEPMLATGRDGGAKVTTTDLLRQVGVLRVRGVVPKQLPLQVLTVGVEYGNQSAVVEDVMADHIPLPLAALDPGSDVSKLLMEVVTQAESLRNAANRLGDDLRQTSGGERLPWDKGQRIGDTLIHQFSPVVHKMLAGLQRDPELVDEAADAWQQTARRLTFDAAEPVLSTVPPSSFLGRSVKSSNTTTRVVNAAVAEAWFRGAVHKILAG